MMNKVFQKLKNKKGFTLVEMLVTIVVLILVTEIILLIVEMSARYYNKSVKESESQILCSTLVSAVKEELEYATTITGSGEDYTYYSRARAHGSGCKLNVSDGKIVVEKGTSEFGLVGSRAYTFDMQSDLSVDWDVANKLFAVTVTIQDRDGTELISEDFNVSPLSTRG